MGKAVIYVAAAVAGVALLMTTLTLAFDSAWGVLQGLLMGLTTAIPLACLYFPYPQLVTRAKVANSICAVVFGYFFLTATDVLAYKTALLTVFVLFAVAIYVRSSPLHQRLEVALSLEGLSLAEKRREKRNG